MSLKEKIRVVLNQRGSFTCPNPALLSSPTSPVSTTPSDLPASESRFDLVVANLVSRKNAKPRILYGIHCHPIPWRSTS